MLSWLFGWLWWLYMNISCVQLWSNWQILILRFIMVFCLFLLKSNSLFPFLKRNPGILSRIYSQVTEVHKLKFVMLIQVYALHISHFLHYSLACFQLGNSPSVFIRIFVQNINSINKERNTQTHTWSLKEKIKI